MPAYQVQNNSSRDKAIRVFGGTKIVKSGGSATLDDAQELSEEQIKDFAFMGVIITLAVKAKPANTEPKPSDKQSAGPEGRIKGNKSA